DPSAAFTRESDAGHRLEADVAGGAVVANNLAAALDAARADALYAEAMFIVLGLPGVLLAALLTHAVAAASRDSRRRELALLRTRGASRAQLQRLVAAEAGTVAVGGTAFGLVVAGMIGRAAFGSVTFGVTATTAVLWA